MHPTTQPLDFGYKALRATTNFCLTNSHLRWLQNYSGRVYIRYLWSTSCRKKL